MWSQPQRKCFICASYHGINNSDKIRKHYLWLSVVTPLFEGQINPLGREQLSLLALQFEGDYLCCCAVWSFSINILMKMYEGGGLG